MVYSVQDAGRTTILTDSHWEGADLVLMARMRVLAGGYATQATVSSISLKVFDLSSGAQVGDTLALLVSAAVFDVLQTDVRWTADDTGYNFRVTIDGDYFPTGDRDYRVEVLFTPTSGKPYPLVTEISVQNLMGS